LATRLDIRRSERTRGDQRVGLVGIERENFLQELQVRPRHREAIVQVVGEQRAGLGAVRHFAIRGLLGDADLDERALVDDVEAMGPGHLQIDDREIGRRLLGLGQGPRAVVRGDHLVAGAGPVGGHLAADHHIVIDHEHAHAGRCGFARRSRIDRHRAGNMRERA
jgi:hypothetical protein